VLRPVGNEHLCSGRGDATGAAASRDPEDGLALGVYPPDVAVRRIRHPDVPATERHAARLPADRHRLDDSVCLRVDADEGVGPGLGGEAASAAREEEGEQGGPDEDEPECGDKRPASRSWLGDAERFPGGLDQLAAGLVALVRVLCQRLGHDLLETRRGGRLVLQVSEENGGVRSSSEGRLTREALVEETTQRVEVRSAVHLLASDLLRGDVVDRAQRLGSSQRRPRLAQASSQAEVGQVHMLALVQQDVRGLDVSVHKAARVSRIECVCDLGDKQKSPARLHGTLVAQETLQIPTLDQAHDDEELALGLANVVDGDDVGVLERSRELGLLQEALAEALIRHQLRREQLESNVALQARVVGAIDDAHAAGAQQDLDPVAGELGAETGISGGRHDSLGNDRAQRDE